MIFQLLAKLIYIFLVVVEIILALRFIFTLLGANRANQLVSLIFQLSNPIVKLFSGIVSDTVTIWGFRIDIVALIALVVLMMIAYGLVEIIQTFEKSS